MSNPYWKVFQTYTRRNLFWFTGAMALIPCFPLISMIVHPSSPASINSGALGFMVFVLYFFAGIIIHLKQQIASPMATLAPNFRAPHFIVAAIIASPVVIGAPLLAAAALHWAFFPLLCASIAATALLAWGVYLNYSPLTILICALLFFPSLPGFPNLGLDILHQGSIPISLILLSGGLAAYAALIRRMSHLNEDYPEFARNIALQSWDNWNNWRSRSAFARINYDGLWAKFTLAASERKFTRLARILRFNLRQRIARRRILLGNRSVILALCMLLVLFQFFVSRMSSDLKITHYLTPLLFLGPVGIGLGRLLLSRNMLSFEIMLPTSRPAYFMELALSIAIQTLEAWLMIALSMIACSALASPQTLHIMTFWTQLGASFLFQSLVLSVALCIFPAKNPLWLFAFIGIICALSSMATVFASRPIPWAGPMALTATLLIASALILNILFLAAAYKRWLHSELG